MLNHKLFGLLLALGMSCLVAAESGAPVLNPDRPDSYVVVKGDTLWDIAGRFLREPWRWPTIWEANPQIKNPHLIYPNDVVSLSYVNGVPRLSVARNGQRNGRRGDTIKLSPEVRATALERPIPMIPLDVVAPFLTSPEVVSREQLDSAPYIVASADEHLVAGAGDRVYVLGLDEAQATQGKSRFTLFRPGEAYFDPTDEDVSSASMSMELVSHNPSVATLLGAKDQNVLGYEAIYVGEVNLDNPGNPATFTIISSSREALTGDRLLPVKEEGFEQNFIPRAPAAAVEGSIISVADGVSQIGRHQVVTLNLGTQDAMEVGHVLAVYQKGEIVRDTVSELSTDTVQLPEERAGLVMVFRTFDQLSYALVMEASGALQLYDVVRNP